MERMEDCEENALTLVQDVLFDTLQLCQTSLQSAIDPLLQSAIPQARHNLSVLESDLNTFSFNTTASQHKQEALPHKKQTIPDTNGPHTTTAEEQSEKQQDEQELHQVSNRLLTLYQLLDRLDDFVGEVERKVSERERRVEEAEKRMEKHLRRHSSQHWLQQSLSQSFNLLSRQYKGEQERLELWKKNGELVNKLDSIFANHRKVAGDT